MSAEAVTYALLSAAAGVTAIVGTKVYPVLVPQNIQPPAVVYTLISAVPSPVMDTTSPTHLMRSRVQVDLVGPDFVQLRALRNAVVAALRFQRGSIGGYFVHSIVLDSDGVPTFDEKLALWHRPLDFIVLHQE